MVYTYLYNEVLAAGKATDPLFTSVTAANIVEGQLDEKEVDIPINLLCNPGAEYRVREVRLPSGQQRPGRSM